MKMSLRVLIAIMLLGSLMLSCMLPGMIPLKSEPEGPMPYMEEDAEKMLETLRGGGVRALEELAQERYTEEDLAKPGTLTYTVTITDDAPTYLTYGWCAVDEATLQQNFEHIAVKMYFNEEELGDEVVHALQYKSPDGMPCLAFGVLMSDWSDGEYKLEAVATFDQKINDGMADYEPGDYSSVYNIVVKKGNEGAQAPSVSVDKTVFQQGPDGLECVL